MDEALHHFIMAIRTTLVTSQPEIGTLIYELRQLTGLTQAKFAASLGFTYPTVSRWENGHAHPSPIAIQKIERLLHRLGAPGEDLMHKYLAESRISKR
jgi:transcriptional regulator with XRE-family HTH domain